MGLLRNRRMLLLAALVLVLGVLVMLNLGTIRQVWRMARGVSLDIGPGGEAAVEVPPGFSATVYARDLQKPRFMAVGLAMPVAGA